jgi:Leucine-rich repeat (LRR) protein
VCSGIEDLEPYLDLISKFEHLQELNLSGNTFTHLPKDLSKLHTIANINLSNVQFDDFEAAVHSLATIGSLKSLYVILFEETQVDLIMRILPDLEFLNGLPVDREALNDSITHSEQRQK